MSNYSEGIYSLYELYKSDEIYIYCFSSDTGITFPAYLTKFSDQITPSWDSQNTYSRMDPMFNYKGTKRKISIGFDIPSVDLEEAKKNFYMMKNFTEGMYPRFDEGGNSRGAAIVNGPPLFTIQFNNYIDSKDGNGLVGVIQSLSYKPEFESGFFIESGNLYPKLYKIDFSFDVLHDGERSFERNSNAISTDIGKFQKSKALLSQYKI